MENILIAVGVVAGLFGIVLVALYNGLVGKRNAVENAFGAVDAILKKRYDLIPNLVAAVQRYLGHERDVLETITGLRAKAVSGNVSSEEAVDLNNRINRAVGKIMVAVENYPDLKASSNFLDLQRSLNEVEEQLSAARRAFNAAVTDLNNAVGMFPGNLVAGAFGFHPRAVFEIPEAERQNVDVKNLFAS
jgi:LemA protein